MEINRRTIHVAAPSSRVPFVGPALAAGAATHQGPQLPGATAVSDPVISSRTIGIQYGTDLKGYLDNLFNWRFVESNLMKA